MAVDIPQPTQQLTSESEMQSIFSHMAVDHRIDDNRDYTITNGNAGTLNEQGFLDDVMWEASDKAYAWLLQRFAEDSLVASRWVRRRVSYIACHILSTRRGNPAQYCDQAEQAMEEFKAVIEGTLLVPGLKPHTDFTPGMSNLVVDDWYTRRKQRTMGDVSSGGDYPDRDHDHGSFGYGTGFF